MNFVFVSMQTKGDHGWIFLLCFLVQRCLRNRQPLATASNLQQLVSQVGNTHFSRQLKVTRGSPANLQICCSPNYNWKSRLKKMSALLSCETIYLSYTQTANTVTTTSWVGVGLSGLFQPKHSNYFAALNGLRRLISNLTGKNKKFLRWLKETHFNCKITAKNNLYLTSLTLWCCKVCVHFTHKLLFHSVTRDALIVDIWLGGKKSTDVTKNSSGYVVREWFQ